MTVAVHHLQRDAVSTHTHTDWGICTTLPKAAHYLRRFKIYVRLPHLKGHSAAFTSLPMGVVGTQGLAQLPLEAGTAMEPYPILSCPVLSYPILSEAWHRTNSNTQKCTGLADLRNSARGPDTGHTRAGPAQISDRCIPQHVRCACTQRVRAKNPAFDGNIPHSVEHCACTQTVTQPAAWLWVAFCFLYMQ
eukprot:1160384-Pelagomonas_calceolata.AAC.6